MGFTVEQDCPQCGAPVVLDETDHLLHCPYCEVKSFLYTSTYFRFVLPDKAPQKDLIYAPFLRFRGSVFYCQGWSVGHRIVDITHSGVAVSGLPLSLGLRPQALKMKFVTPETKGSFLRFSMNAAEIIERAGQLPVSAPDGRLYYKGFIGETLSIIYLPVYFEGEKLYDAVLNRAIASIPEGDMSISHLVKEDPRWRITFLPALCPDCGWNLEGERGSVVLLCNNCGKAWEAFKGKFVQIECGYLSGEDKDTVYLPFWKFTASSEGLEINSFADFMRLTNQPRVVRDEWENVEMSYWTPAFKIRPKIFLNLSRQMTISTDLGKTKEALPGKKYYPVTLPREEAVKSMKLILAYSTVRKKDVISELPGTRFSVKGSMLVYLPFTDRGLEMVQQKVGTSISKNTLEFGRQL